MREQLARWVALFVAAVTVLLALVFAWVQNPPPPDVAVPRVSPAPPLPTPEPARVEMGRAVYEAQDCGMCHSIAGVGNPRNPLDGVGARLERYEIRQWIVGAGELEGRLPAGVFRVKQRYQALPAGELDALIAYMQSLQN